MTETNRTDGATGDPHDGESARDDARDDDAAPAATVDPAVTVDELAHGFGDVTVLDGVSLAVEPGSLLSVVGPNGSGKSTLLRIVAGLLRPDGGRVDVDRRGVRPIGYLPQRPSFRPGFTVADTLAFYADLLGPDGGTDVDEVLDQVGLAGVRNRNVEALSGGMTRLLGLAQALLGDPAVLVLDEPASGLDPAISAHIFETIRDVADDGRAVLLASHDLVAVERTADRVVLLDRGRFVVDGVPRELIADADADGLVDVFLSAVSDDEDGDRPTVRTGLQSGVAPDDLDGGSGGDSR
ncbi:ABC transporter ATP-binding protein [Salinigranum salinum]|uniref:ABC transporter ATP-binding protein n=1 Tax=Salinigranum salinum TaxID=1364937 RepID=UPI0012605E51|nr:ABC transporter ATP-binding protein [Salinigranum salinum]